MTTLLQYLRKQSSFHDKLRQVYGRTVGLWKVKELFLKKVGLYNGRHRVRLMESADGDQLICERIQAGQPLMVTRYGSTEFRTLHSKHDVSLLCFYSGFFPNDGNLWEKFCETYFECSRQIDILAVWNYKNHFLKKARLVRRFPNIEAFVPLGVAGGFNTGWLPELQGKRLLVVHPFKKTIEMQYKKREKLRILPELANLEVVQAVQTIAGTEDPRFKDWFEALESMKNDIAKADFDIALIACGAYGLPLAAHVKSLGKQAIHVGGSLQLLFGIKGKRWDRSDGVQYTDDWTVPLKEDTPDNHAKVEAGCYW